MQKPQSLTANGIQTKIESQTQANEDEILVLQILGHKEFDSSDKKKGIKSR